MSCLHLPSDKWSLLTFQKGGQQARADRIYSLFFPCVVFHSNCTTCSFFPDIVWCYFFSFLCLCLYQAFYCIWRVYFFKKKQVCCCAFRQVQLVGLLSVCCHFSTRIFYFSCSAAGHDDRQETLPSTLKCLQTMDNRISHLLDICKCSSDCRSHAADCWCLDKNLYPVPDFLFFKDLFDFDFVVPLFLMFFSFQWIQNLCRRLTVRQYMHMCIWVYSYRRKKVNLLR